MHTKSSLCFSTVLKNYTQKKKKKRLYRISLSLPWCVAEIGSSVFEKKVIHLNKFQF